MIEWVRDWKREREREREWENVETVNVEGCCVMNWTSLHWSQYIVSNQLLQETDKFHSDLLMQTKTATNLNNMYL